MESAPGDAVLRVGGPRAEHQHAKFCPCRSVLRRSALEIYKLVSVPRGSATLGLTAGFPARDLTAHWPSRTINNVKSIRNKVPVSSPSGFH